MNKRNKLNSHTDQESKLKWEDTAHIRYHNILRTLGIREYQGCTRQVRLVYLAACLPGGCSSPGQALGNFTSRGFNETVQQALVLPYIAACISSSASKILVPWGEDHVATSQSARLGCRNERIWTRREGFKIQAKTVSYHADKASGDTRSASRLLKASGRLQRAPESSTPTWY